MHQAPFDSKPKARNQGGRPLKELRQYEELALTCMRAEGPSLNAELHRQHARQEKLKADLQDCLAGSLNYQEFFREHAISEIEGGKRPGYLFSRPQAE